MGGAVPQDCAGRAGHGEAVQVEPIKPTLKAPGSKRLKLEHEKTLSNFAFKLNLRRYSMAPPRALKWYPDRLAGGVLRTSTITNSTNPVRVSV